MAVGEDRQDRLECVVRLAEKPFRAKHRAVVRAAGPALLDDALGRLVAVERDHVGHRHQGLGHAAVEVAKCADRQRLRGPGLARPTERGRHQRQTLLAHIRVARLVVKVPNQHASVLAELAHEVFDVSLQVGPRVPIDHSFQARAGDPTAVVYARHGLVLLAQVGLATGEGTIAKRNEHHAHPVLLGNREELVHPLLQSLGIVLPDEILHEHPQAVVARLLGPTEFLVDRFRIEGLLLPHFGHVHGRPRQIVAPGDRSRLGIPGPSLLLGPACPTIVVECREIEPARRLGRLLLGIEDQPHVDILPAGRLMHMDGHKILTRLEGLLQRLGHIVRIPPGNEPRGRKDRLAVDVYLGIFIMLNPNRRQLELDRSVDVDRLSQPEVMRRPRRPNHLRRRKSIASPKPGLPFGPSRVVKPDRVPILARFFIRIPPRGRRPIRIIDQHPRLSGKAHPATNGKCNHGENQTFKYNRTHQNPFPVAKRQEKVCHQDNR